MENFLIPPQVANDRTAPLRMPTGNVPTSLSPVSLPQTNLKVTWLQECVIAFDPLAQATRPKAPVA